MLEITNLIYEDHILEFRPKHNIRSRKCFVKGSFAVSGGLVKICSILDLTKYLKKHRHGPRANREH